MILVFAAVVCAKCTGIYDDTLYLFSKQELNER